MLIQSITTSQIQEEFMHWVSMLLTNSYFNQLLINYQLFHQTNHPYGKGQILKRIPRKFENS